MSAEPQGTHDTSDSLLAGPGALASECTTNSRCAIAAAMLMENLRYLRCQHGIVHGPRAGLCVQPFVVAATRDTKDPAASCYRDVRPLRVNELVHGYFTSFAKRAAAFLRNSLDHRRLD